MLGREGVIPAVWGVSIIEENHTMETRGWKGLYIPVTNLKGLVTRSSSDILKDVVLHNYGKGCGVQWGMMGVGLSWLEWTE